MATFLSRLLCAGCGVGRVGCSGETNHIYYYFPKVWNPNDQIRTAARTKVNLGYLGCPLDRLRAFLGFGRGGDGVVGRANWLMAVDQFIAIQPHRSLCTGSIPTPQLICLGENPRGDLCACTT